MLITPAKHLPTPEPPPRPATIRVAWIYAMMADVKATPTPSIA